MKLCPFCRSVDIDPKGWLRNDGTTGPQCMGCGATAESVEAWNHRNADPLLTEALEAIKGAMRIKDLWAVPDDVELDFPGEAEAVQLMESRFRSITNKAEEMGL